MKKKRNLSTITTGKYTLKYINIYDKERLVIPRWYNLPET